jgi:hypothetical protein
MAVVSFCWGGRGLSRLFVQLILLHYFICIIQEGTSPHSHCAYIAYKYHDVGRLTDSILVQQDYFQDQTPKTGLGHQQEKGVSNRNRLRVNHPSTLKKSYREYTLLIVII